jgi:hypothetical protein
MQISVDQLISDIPLTARMNGGALSTLAGDPATAEQFYRRAISMFPADAVAHNNLGLLWQLQERHDDATMEYRRALVLNPALRAARRNLALLLVRIGRSHEARELLYCEIADASEGLPWLHEVISAAMGERDLRFAGELAAVLAMSRWGSRFYPGDLPIPSLPPRAFVTLAKLNHDIEQLDYLKRRGVFGEEIDSIIVAYRRTIERLAPRGGDGRYPLDAETEAAIGDTYNRILHLRRTPRVLEPFSAHWDPHAVERDYLAGPLGLVVVDDFLSDEALDEVRHFCLESTVWSGIRYAHGRLGAFFYDGFNCPLLLQIAERLRVDLPNVIADHPLRQLWGFKNTEPLPADSTNHADFAAVNVNLWITPDDANLDPATGGLVVYDVDAPLSWEFERYNGRSDRIRRFLTDKGARRLTIPYRQNRAIIFNSDLFHATSEVTFRSGYENRRINITMLYGEREGDVHHPNLVREQPLAHESAWRSLAFARLRDR